MLSTIGGHVYNLFTIPLLTNYLSKDEFGFYTILVQMVVILQSSLAILIANGLLKFWVDTKEENKVRFISSIFIFYIISDLLLSLCVYIFRNQLIPSLFPNISLALYPAMLFTLLWLFFISLRSFLIVFVYTLEKPVFALIHIITYGVLLVALLAYQLVYKGANVSDVMSSFAIAEMLAILILLIPTKKYLNFYFNLAFLKIFMKFSLPLIGGSLAFITFQNIDRIVLARYVSLEDMGVYGIGFMFGNIAGMIVSANMSAYLPRVKKVMASGDEVEVKRLTTHYMQEMQDLMLIVVFGIALFSKLIVYLFANSYSGSLASLVMIGVALGHLARSNYLFFEQILFLKDRVKTIFVVKVLILVLGSLLAVVLISQFNLYGASLVYLATFLLINIVAYNLINSYNLVEISIKRTIAVGLVILSLILLQYLDINIFFLYSIEALILGYLSYRYLKLYILKKATSD